MTFDAPLQAGPVGADGTGRHSLEFQRSGVTVGLVGVGMYPGAGGLLLMELERPARPTSTAISQAVEKLGVHKLRALRIVERSGRFPIDPQQSLEDTNY